MSTPEQTGICPLLNTAKQTDAGGPQYPQYVDSFLSFQSNGRRIIISPIIRGNFPLSLPKTPSELKMQRFRAFMRSCCYHDELSFRRFFVAGRLQLSNPCCPASGDPRVSSPTCPFSKRTRRLVCASSAPTGFCGFCSRDGGPVGAGVYTSFAPIQ